MKEYIGLYRGQGLKIGIVVSRFNELVTKNLLAGAVDGLIRHGVASDDISIVWVPGAFEIPVAAKVMAQSGAYHAVICLGAVIRGATAHFEHVAGQSASGIAHVALETSLPIIYEILTTETMEQAMERAGSKSGNKGFDAALIALEMANVLAELKKGSSHR